MANFSWLALLRALSPAALTVRAQTISPNDMGKLYWDRFLPRADVNSIRLSDIFTLDDRPVADRREWNAPGRRIPLVTPNFRDMTMTPIESNDVIDEEEMQLLNERGFGNEDIIRQTIAASLPQRTDRLASSNYRRLEVDAMQAWTAGTITVRNPQDASKTVTSSYGFSSSRYLTAGTAWNDGSVNAYDLFLTWIQNAIDAVGGVEGAVMRLATLQAIQADTPTAFGVFLPRVTRGDLTKRIQDELGGPFEFVIMEDSHDIFDDGGITKTRTKVWPAHKVAAIPMGGTVGNTYFAPVVRAMEMSQQLPAAGIDVRGNTVFHFEENNGRELQIECQLNALPAPDESKCYVIDAGV